MDIVIILAGIIGSLVVTIAVLYTLNAAMQKRMEEKLALLIEQQKNDQSTVLLNQNIQGMQERLDKVSDGLNLRLDNAARVINAVNKELGQVHEMNRSMRDLQNFLKSPKLRGNLGEQVLKELLSQSLPDAYYDIQYSFTSGQVVDAIIKTDNGLISIDSKFPLENFDKMSNAESEVDEESYRKLFTRDVKKHIKDIAKKYIVPEENTVNFAVMYVPSESIYYEIVRDDQLINGYAQEHKVVLVSPNSFYYFLQVLLLGMQGKRIEQQAKEILSIMEGIGKDAAKFSDTLSVVNTHINNAGNAMERANNDYTKLYGKIEQAKLLK